jgi:hypothetical protein
MFDRFAHVYTVLSILILIAALNASRLFYLPLTKLRTSSSDVNAKSSPSIVQQSFPGADAGKPIPASVMERPLNSEEDKPRSNFASNSCATDRNAHQTSERLIE